MMLQQMLDHCNNNKIASEEAHSNYLLYLELCEVKKYWDVNWSYKNSVFFCSARKFKEGPLLTFVPFSMKRQLTLDLIETLQATFDTKTIILVIQHPDSTSLYYEITEGLVNKSEGTPISDAPTESYIRNNKKFLYTRALNGT